MNKKNILFCHTGRSSFVDADMRILESDYDVIEYQYKPSSNWSGKIANLAKSLYIAIKCVPQVDIVYSFFAGFHCFFPFLVAGIFKKKKIVTIGGYDAVSIPVIKYGIFYKQNLLAFCTKIIYRIADFLLPVHNSLILSQNEYLNDVDKNAKIGILNFVNEVNGVILEVPTGYDPEIYKRNMHITRKAGVLSIASIENEQDFIRKGFDLIFKAADIMPEVEFVLAGFNDLMLEKLQNTKPKNLTLIGFLSRTELINLYSEYKVFLQPSLCEGLPNTLCEAMLCECIPVGSAVCGIPDVIGDTGYILKRRNENLLLKSIQSSIETDENGGLIARQRIIDFYPLVKRKASISKLINDDN